MTFDTRFYSSPPFTEVLVKTTNICFVQTQTLSDRSQLAKLTKLTLLPWIGKLLITRGATGDGDNSAEVSYSKKLSDFGFNARLTVNQLNTPLATSKNSSDINTLILLKSPYITNVVWLHRA